MADALMSTYARQPVAFARGEGAWLWDEQGKRYLDAVSGIAVCGLGHAHPDITRAIAEQAGRLLHTSNLYEVTLQRRLAERLTALTGMDRVFFSNSGAEANEAAIKLARLHGHQKGIATPTIIVMEGSFHGRTLATLTATGNRRVQAGFEPLVQGFVRVPFNDLDAIEAVARNASNIVAVLVEPIQCEGGVHVPDDGYLAGLRRLCDAQGWLLMLDEIQTGNGRTGRFLCAQHTGVQADVVTLAKGLGNGVPIGACLARGAAAEAFRPGNHGSTFGGNPLACAAALAVVDVLERDHLMERARVLGDRLRADLRKALADVAGVRDIRGRGLIIGIELAQPCAPVVALARDAGLLVNVTADKVIRLLPPLILSDADAATLVSTLAGVVRRFAAENAA